MYGNNFVPGIVHVLVESDLEILSNAYLLCVEASGLGIVRSGIPGSQNKEKTNKDVAEDLLICHSNHALKP